MRKTHKINPFDKSLSDTIISCISFSLSCYKEVVTPMSRRVAVHTSIVTLFLAIILVLISLDFELKASSVIGFHAMKDFQTISKRMQSEN